MAQDNSGKTSTTRQGRKLPTPMKFSDASHPIFSNPTVMGFVQPTPRSTESSSDDSQPKTKSTSRPKILDLLARLHRGANPRDR